MITDVIRQGKAVTSQSFNSNGRYGQRKLMRERFIQRLLNAKPEALIDASDKPPYPQKVWQTLFTHEKHGKHGKHGKRSVSIALREFISMLRVEPPLLTSG